ncbi:MAG: hypothetical protein ABH967_01685 [Patescibacteria group bacterium]
MIFDQFVQLFLESFVEHLPKLLWANITFLVGLLVSKWIASWVVVLLNKTKFNQALKRMSWESLEDAGFNMDGVEFFSNLVRCFFTLLFLMASAEIIGLPQFSNFLAQAVNYFSNIFIAAFIFIVAVFIADFSQKIVVASLEEEKITYSRFLGRVIRWIIWALTVLIILYQLQITPTLILTIFVGLIATITLTIGIAFGLGGKEIASKILKDLEEKIR